MTDWFGNGESTGYVSIDDRGFQYGDGLFETVAIRGGETRLWPFHMDRLGRGCKLLGIKKPLEADLLSGVMHALQHSSATAAYCVAKIIVSAGASRRGYGRTHIDSPPVYFGVFASSPPPVESYRDGIDTTLCQTRLAVNSATAGLKTLNRLEQVLARSEFSDSGEVEGLTMDADDNVICGTMSNVFFVRGRTIITPSLRRCGVDGVMRQHVIESLAEQGIPTEIQTIRQADIKNVDEVFISNSQVGILPVRSCSSFSWPVGEVTKNVMAILAKNGVVECR